MAIAPNQQHPGQPSHTVTEDNNNNNSNVTRKRSRRKNRSESFSDASSSSSSLDGHSTFSSNDSSSTSSPPPSPTRKTNRRRRRGGSKNKSKKTEQQQQQQPVVETLSLEEQAQYVALDCEMVGVGYNGRTSSLARVTLVGWNGEVIMDQLIKQDRPVTDFRTFVSGITEQDLYGENADVMELDECVALVRSHLDGKILVGHALKNDMHALGIRHPWQMTRDTAKYEPFMKVRFNDGILWPRKLRDLVHEKLKQHTDFQQPGEAHSPYEDAMAALNLYKLVRNKWEKVMDYKISKTKEIQQAAASAPTAKPVVSAVPDTVEWPTITTASS